MRRAIHVYIDHALRLIDHAWCFIAHATMRARSQYIFLVAFGRERKKMLACDFSYQIVKSSSTTSIKPWDSYYT